MKRFIKAAIEHNRAVLLSLGALILGGIIVMIRIPKEADPEVVIPTIYVFMVHEGISPEDAERLLIRPVEQEVRSLEGIKEVSATANLGSASVFVEFEAGIDVRRALQDVREKVDIAKAEFPADTEEPFVSEVKMNRFNPMLVLNVAGAVPERTLVALTRDLKEKIALVPGVLEVNLAGDREELIEISIDPVRMESYNLSQADVLNLFQRNNRLVAAGSLQTGQGRFPVKVPGVFENLQDILGMPVKVDGDNVVRFSDIASVRRTYKDAESFARLNGEAAIAVEIVQRAGANVIQTANEVWEVLRAEQENWPPGISVVASRDQSVEIEEQVRELWNHILIAVVLVAIVILGTLGVRNALLVGIAIPGSFLIGMLVMGVAGLSMNMVSMFAMIMAVGMLVDGAIIVVELADRKMAEGIPKREAYAIASQRMVGPVVASILTSIIVFVPLAFWPGMMGQFMKYMPITLIAVLTASLVMALVYVPVLGALFGKASPAQETAHHNLVIAESGDLRELGGWTGKYIRYLERILRHPWRNIGAVTALLFAIFVAYGLFGRGVEFFPTVDSDIATLEIRARGDLSTEEKDLLVRQVEQRIAGIDDVKFMYAKTGASGRGAAADTIGTIQLTFVDWRERRPVAEILAEVRERTAQLSGIVVDARMPQAGMPRGKPIDIEIGSRFPELIEPATVAIREVLTAVPGVLNVEDDRPISGIEWKMDVDRAQAARFGADVTLVGTAIQLVTTGARVGEYRPDDADDEIDIRVRFPYDARNLDQVDELRVMTAQGLVPISSFVTRKPVQKVSTLNRTDLRRTMHIRADLEPGVLEQDVVRQVRAKLPELQLDPRIELQFKGNTREQAEAQNFIFTAFLIALGLIGVILVLEFNSIYQTLLILTAVLFSIGGVLLGHLLTQQPFGTVMSGIGLITLAGIVVSNNIVLIDTYNALLKEGMTPMEAILRTCAQRLRPVLLTKITMILGLLPMVFGITVDLAARVVTIGGPSAQWWTQLAASVVGGLIFATVLTLLFTPSLLLAEAGVRERRIRRRA
ncbi:MAG: efflux RND transporter permease subunit, partial [Gammaproteobacteria bacterium]|nr:efflux RND transporter permease subunit [Gammaproteobacteria bacterium]